MPIPSPRDLALNILSLSPGRAKADPRWLRHAMFFSSCDGFRDSFAQAADSYCWYTSGTLSDGQTVSAVLKIVVSSVDRPHIAGEPDRRPWCIQERHSLGGPSSSKIIERPKLGQVGANGYRVSYRGDRVGQDRFVIERRWQNGSSNEWLTGRIVYEVEVVAQPF